MEKRISLITVYNNEKLVREMTDSAAVQQGVSVEYILLDNRGRKFESAAAALNEGIEKSTGEVLVFLHQDIEFLSEGVLEDIYDYAVKNKRVIFGSAGVERRTDSKTGGGLLSSMFAGPDKTKYNTLSQPQKAFTLDECLIACHRSCVNELRFDERVCDGWHLYGADLCLQAQALYRLEVYAVPIDCWHKSNGNADESYFECQERLGKKYRKYYKIVNTTNGYVYTNTLKRFIQKVYRKIRYR